MPAAWSLSPEPVLRGRDGELAMLSTLLDDAEEVGRSILLEGDAGIGKSTLLDAAVDDGLARGFQVLRCAGLQDAAAVGYDALHELVHQLLPLVDRLPDRQRDALLTAFAVEDGRSPDRLLVSVAALSLLEEAAAVGPVLLAVEDLQWIDRSSAWVIDFVGRRVAPSPIVLVATMRTGDERTAPATVGFDRLEIGPLDADDAVALLTEVAPELSELARRRILREAGGNPLALREFPVALRDHGISRIALQAHLPTTQRLERAFLDRLVGLPESSRRLLVLAIAADGAHLQDVIAAGRGLGLGLEDLEPLESSRLVSVVGASIRLRHPLVRSAVQGSATTVEWTQAHAALAAVIDDHARAAWHRASASVERNESIAEELDQAARRAHQRGAQAEAVRAWQRAATLSQGADRRAQRLVSASEVARAAGLTLEASEMLEEVERIATDPGVVADAAVTRGRLSLRAGVRPHDFETIMAISRTLAHRPEDTDRRIALLWETAVSAKGRNLPHADRERLEAELDAVPTSSPLKSVALAVLAPLGRVPELRAGLPALVSQVLDAPIAMTSLAIAAESLHDLETALTCWGLSLERFHELGEIGDEAQAVRGRGGVLLLRGRVRDGLADAEYAARMARDTSQPLLERLALSTVARAQAMLGDFDATRETLAAFYGQPGDSLAFSMADARWAAGLVALGEHRFRDAMIELTHVAVHDTRALWAIADRTEAAVRGGRPETVVDNVARAAIAADASHSSYLAALVARSRALLSSGATAEIEYRNALEAGEISEAPLEQARTHLLLGEWLRRERRVVEARGHLAEALRVFDLVGARVFAERAASELRAAGESPVRAGAVDTPVRDRLTPQELQVAQLAAGGLSNRDIADRIYLSHRTVSTHLYRVFPKLGITGRAHLKDALEVAGYPL